MSKFSASDAAFSGFRLVRENLKSVGIWMLIMTVVSIAYSVVMIQFFGAQMNAISTFMQTAGPEPDQNELAKLLSGMAPAMLISAPYMLLVNGVVFAGVNRLVQRPHEKGFAHLKLGMDEVRQAGVWALLNLVLFVVLTFGMVVSNLLTEAGGAGGALLAVLIFLGMIGGVVYLSIRLSLASPATFDNGKVTFFRSMPLTKDCFWPIFGAYFLAGVMCVIVFLLLMAIVTGLAALISGDLNFSSRMMQADTTSLKAYFSPAGIAQAMLSGAMSVLTSLIIFTPGPAIYQALNGRDAQPSNDGGW